MSLYRPDIVDNEPDVNLVNWSVYDITFENHPIASRHFVGSNTYSNDGRVSSPIVSYDSATMTGKTRSGRTYHLSGSPGYSKDGSYVFGVWKAYNKVTDIIDVSDEYAKEDN